METQALMSCQHLSGVGPRIAARLARMGIQTLSDLIFHLPARYEDRTRVSLVRALKPPASGVIEGVIEGVAFPPHGRTKLQLTVRDPSGIMTLRFFHVYSTMRQVLSRGVRIRCFGEVRWGATGPEMIHPEWQLADALSADIEPCLTAVYPTTEGVGQSLLRKLMKQALERLTQLGMLREILPPEMLKVLAFPSLLEALHFVHCPPADTTPALLMQFQHPFQRRLIFEELLAHRLGLLDVKQSIQILQATPFAAKDSLITPFMTGLPYALTDAQQKVWADICQDVSRARPMLRLVQGDVGCGKTVIAALAALKAIENQAQAALLAPTELLVEQHFQTFQRWFTPLGIRVERLSARLKSAERRSILSGLSAGDVDFVIGTHAVFQKEVVFSNLALFVVDEQHRFGVHQRLLLREKGVTGGVHPHQLILTATPIPRTLAMSVYADLDYSVIDELPPGRLPILTRLIPEARRAEIIERLRETCKEGQQAYWVCTRIEESEEQACRAAEEALAEMTAALPTLRIGMVHGRMKPDEKEQNMSLFRAGALDVLVATTVIEVGVDVPTANVMVIENAERLGLAQLHQLRGRVGRGQTGGFCLLLYRSPLSSFAKERLAAIRETVDGFKIAERDLALRGPGEVLGVRQAGEMSFRIADLLRDGDLLPKVEAMANQLRADHPECITHLLQRWLGSREGYGYV